MVKLIASDLDGTIIDKSNNIFQENLKAIEKINKANIPFVVCTGKHILFIKNYVLLLMPLMVFLGMEHQL